MQTSLQHADFAIVLTGTIIPNVTGAATLFPEERLKQYLDAIEFYRKYASVYFLENSGYDLASRPEFQEAAGFQVRAFPRSSYPERGKGFQEFEMIDQWINSEPQPPSRWLKITGRYRLLNVESIVSECVASNSIQLIIDRAVRTKTARTYAFCVNTKCYEKYLLGIYKQCDDGTGDWIERILYREMTGWNDVKARSFATQPRLAAVAGGTGVAFPQGKLQWILKQFLRTLNRSIDKSYLWYSK